MGEVCEQGEGREGRRSEAPILATVHLHCRVFRIDGMFQFVCYHEKSPTYMTDGYM